MKKLGRRALAATVALLLCGGCEKRGVVTDAATGLPMEDVQVGLIVANGLSPHATTFREMARTDASGKYRFYNYRPSPHFTVQTPDYLTINTYFRAAPDTHLDFELQSIAAIKGAWDAAVRLPDESIREFQFTFAEEGLALNVDGEDVGVVKMTFDGTDIAVDGFVRLSTFYILGELRATLKLDASGDQMSGQVSFGRVYQEEFSGAITVLRATSR